MTKNKIFPNRKILLNGNKFKNEIIIKNQNQPINTNQYNLSSRQIFNFIFNFTY